MQACMWLQSIRTVVKSECSNKPASFMLFILKLNNNKKILKENNYEI